MAASADDPSDAESLISEDVETQESYYSCCTKKACKTLICTYCDKSYHKSCAARRNLKMVSDTRVECCETSRNNYTNSEKETILEVQIQFLNKLLAEVKEKNDILKENNNILKENNKLLVLRINELEKNRDINNVKTYCQATKTSRDCEAREDRHRQNFNNKQIKPQNTYQRRVVQEQHEVVPISNQDASTSITLANDICKHPLKQTTLMQHEQPQQTKAKNDVELSFPQNNATVNTNSKNLDQNTDFKLVQNRKRYRRKRLGTGKMVEENGFAGPEPKVWINIYRVNNHVTNELVEKHIKKQPGFAEEDISVSELETKSNQHLKSFLVTAPLKRKEEMYEPSFWPPNVGIRRFRFDIHRKSGANFLEIV